ncbi:MAG: MBL fold metallo-hydrolase [Deltaproteobacteria bacterium]|nr:MBL fold metallo-hydrolase [Deltaproteobacteria bacterium]
MHMTFYGAVREVTGSMHLLSAGNERILFDCGMFQGRRKEAAEKNRVLPFDPSMISTCVLSHAHIDHSGRIPLLTKNNFIGRVICTRSTAASCEYLLPDSGHIQESDANYLNYKMVRSVMMKMKNSAKGKKNRKNEKDEIAKRLKKNRNKLNVEAIDDLIKKYHLKSVEPIYSTDDAEQALTFFDGYPYNHPISIGRDVTCTLYDAGHILGSAISIIRVKKNGRICTIGYTGDIGRFDKPIINDPTLEFAQEDRKVDLLIMESTYGNREHEPVVDLKPHLKKEIVKTYNRGGSVIIPSFAFGRTQELLYFLHELYNENEVPRLPVYVDSPLATEITRVFGEHPEVYDQETHETFLEQKKNPFSFKQVHFTKSVEESMALNREKKPHIVISASGMCEAGRILHHLRFKIHNSKNTILIVGYMAMHTLGRRILEEGSKYEKSGRSGAPPMLKFFNKEYPLKAHVVKLGGFSAHGDKNEMLRFVKKSNLQIKRIAVVHGEEDQSVSFAEHLNKEGFAAFVPKKGETLQIQP